MFRPSGCGLEALVLAFVALWLSSCARMPRPVAEGVGSTVPTSVAEREPGWHLERQLCPREEGCEVRFFPELRVLHLEPTRDSPGDDLALLPGGALGARVPLFPENYEPPGELTGITTAVKVIGAWPERVWVLQRWHGTQPGLGYTQGDNLSLIERISSGGSPTLFQIVGNRYQPEGFLDVVAWGERGALAFGLGYEAVPNVAAMYEDPVEGWVVPAAESCDEAVIRRDADDAPEHAATSCELWPVAVATSTGRDLFLALSTLRVNAPNSQPDRRTLEMRRWRRGRTDPVRDELDVMLGWEPGVIDSWGTRTLLVASDSEAYFAVSKYRDGQNREYELGDVAVLHFDGRTWVEVLSTFHPWGGIERAEDGSIWVVSADQLYVMPASRRTNARFELVVPPKPLDSSPALSPLQVLPWSSLRASVIARRGEELGLYTVTTGARLPPSAL